MLLSKNENILLPSKLDESSKGLIDRENNLNILMNYKGMLNSKKSSSILTASSNMFRKNMISNRNNGSNHNTNESNKSKMNEKGNEVNEENDIPGYILCCSMPFLNDNTGMDHADRLHRIKYIYLFIK